MKNFKKMSVKNEGRTELHNSLQLTGAEISINAMPAKASVPFVHSHKENEEIYGFLEGNGYFEIDGEKVEFSQGDWIKVAPKAKRQMFAESDIKYICIQVKENSLEQFTQTDAIIY
ncbi:cupin [Gallibacterium salpingitidis]|uniref:Cupin n=1 Tax=Gallibacterium salpingitidis TaxID=505341 RepID=A0A1A7Q1P6_9PAST|nr:cupin domain-containing protein [Gallibacterium salpingitidis]OBW95210.1 cupin [Gallibacterium salpingitidis]OBX07852.1 cupin [Gallibacterium salpingitidis]WKT00782.1 cupin domain-containing protein [Gallibacterium salpingitidis]